MAFFLALAIAFFILDGAFAGHYVAAANRRHEQT
jgi:hypothetical protein